MIYVQADITELVIVSYFLIEDKLRFTSFSVWPKVKFTKAQEDIPYFIQGQPGFLIRKILFFDCYLTLWVLKMFNIDKIKKRCKVLNMSAGSMSTSAKFSTIMQFCPFWNFTRKIAQSTFFDCKNKSILFTILLNPIATRKVDNDLLKKSAFKIENMWWNLKIHSNLLERLLLDFKVLIALLKQLNILFHIQSYLNSGEKINKSAGAVVQFIKISFQNKNTCKILFLVLILFSFFNTGSIIIHIVALLPVELGHFERAGVVVKRLVRDIFWHWIRYIAVKII